MGGHYEKLDFASEESMWVTFIFNWTALIIIWIFWSYVFLIFCFRSQSPKCHHFSSKEISSLNKKFRSSASVLSRSSISDNRNSIDSITIRNSIVNRNSNAKHNSANDIQSSRQLSMIGIPIKQTIEEFEIQICKIHRNLRLLFLCSITFGALYITYTCFNQTIVTFSNVKSICTANKFPTFFLALQRISLYTFFISRIHYSFGKTQYKINYKCIIALEIFVVLVSITSETAFLYSSIYACENMRMATAIVGLGDFMVQLILIITFLNRLIKAIGIQKSVLKSQTKETLFNVLNVIKNRKRTTNERKIRKDLQRTYKFYYTIFKLFVLFATTVVLTWFVIGIGLATASISSSACYDQIISNIMLFMAFQFNDNHYRWLFHSCLKCQSCCLGGEYAKQMENNFVTRAQHRMGSRTFMKYDSQYFPREKMADNADEDEDVEQEPLEVISERTNETFQISTDNNNLLLPDAKTDNNNKYKNVGSCTPLESENENERNMISNTVVLNPVASSSVAVFNNNTSNSSNVNSNGSSIQVQFQKIEHMPNMHLQTSTPLIVIEDNVKMKGDDRDITPKSHDSENVDKFIEVEHISKEKIIDEELNDSYVSVDHLDLDDIPPAGPERISSFEST